jgi:hypothetical protein
VTPSTARAAAKASYTRFLQLLTERVFPRVVALMTRPETILLTMLLIVPLLLLSGFTAIAIAGNTYLNVASASVSMIVLYQSLRHHREVKQMHAESTRRDEAHAAEIARVHARLDAAERAALLNEDTQPIVQPVTRPTLVPTEPRPGAKRAGHNRAKPAAKSAARRRSRGFDPVDPIDEEE